MRFAWTGFIVAGLLAGCIAAPTGGTGRESGRAAAPALPEPVLTALGGRLTVRVAAESWPQLLDTVKPTFAWNGRDLMWIGCDGDGQPQFTLDRAFVLQPPGARARWVLLGCRDAPFDESYGAVMGENLRGVARVCAAVPVSDHGAGDYAVVKGEHPRFGTVYEIGWERLMANGTSLAAFGRRLYLLRDHAGRWRFLGEGPEEGHGKCGGFVGYSTCNEARVVWTNAPGSKMPVEIRFVQEQRDSEWRRDDDAAVPLRRDQVVYAEAVLGGKFPAPLRWTTQRPYLLSGEGDSFEGLVEHLASWTLGWNSERKETRRNIVRMWRRGLARLNPGLLRGSLMTGTRVNVLTYAETVSLLRDAAR